jgi:hypothetical protein
MTAVTTAHALQTRPSSRDDARFTWMRLVQRSMGNRPVGEEMPSGHELPAAGEGEH